MRPASPLISKRHCGLITRNEQVFVRDYESTNGTFVNQHQVNGEMEIKNGDLLRVGPLEFRISLETSVPVDRRTPLPVNRSTVPSPEEEAAALLLSVHDADTGGSPLSNVEVDKDGVPTGSTIHDKLQPADTDHGTPDAEVAKKEEEAKADESKLEKAKQAAADTSTAANAILTKYLRRPRT
jgi:pSer/pThr/pTyr-binding forkhead associated (FHA) protein